MHYISILLLGLVAAITADVPLPLDVEVPESRNTAGSAYRLPEDLDPIHYDVEITPYLTASGNNAAFSFDGIVKITVEAKRDGLNSFVIHENVRTIRTVTLSNAAGQNIPLHPTTPFERITQHQFLRVNLPVGQVLYIGARYILTVDYIGNINETPLSRGVFRGHYRDATGQQRWYAATHLQPTHSRQAFPSFDEPGFKSTFRIIINRLPTYTETYSNMKIETSVTSGDRIKETFNLTPRMSAYLVTFHISEGFTVIADNKDDLKPYRILARPNAQGQGEYALEVGPPLTDWLSEYFKIEYYDMEPGIKNDQIASPYWASGATENWGLVTYRELRLLYEEGETNAADKLSIGTITAHELAHKWFGNLITCRWWDNVWINEGFASYFEYFAMDGVYPELQIADQFNIMYVQSALSADSATSTRALQHTVNSPTEVTGHFTGISYSKGASLLLMLKHFVSEDTFKKALNYFLVENSFEHTFPADLYNAFAKAVSEDEVSIATDIAGFMKYWVEEQGYPLLQVNVNRQTGRIDLTQTRFFISATALPTTQAWPIPLTYTTQSNPNWNNLQPSKVMTTRTDFIDNAAGSGWVIFNVQQKGIYRVNYDEQNWWLLAYALNSDHTQIHHLNRAQIVDDVFAFMRSGNMRYELGFRVLEFLKKDTSYYSWYPAITGFNWLRNRLLHIPDRLAAFDNILFQYLEAVITDLGYDVVANEHLTRTLNRFYVLSFACNIGHQACVNNAVAKFQAFMTNSATNPVNPNLRRHVFCQGLRAGGLPEWTFLNNRRQNSNNQADEAAMLRSLGCTTNDAARQQYLTNILNDDFVKAQDRVNAFTFFYMGDRSNARYALAFLRENYAAIRTAVVLPAWFNNILSTIAGYLDTEGLLEMETWLNNNQATIPEYQSGISAIASARTSMLWGTNNAEVILTAAGGSTDELTTPITLAPTIQPTTVPVTVPFPVTVSTPEPATEPQTTELTTESTSESTSPTTPEVTTVGSTTPDPNSAAIFVPTSMILLWSALAMLLK